MAALTTFSMPLTIIVTVLGVLALFAEGEIGSAVMGVAVVLAILSRMAQAGTHQQKAERGQHQPT